MKSSINALRESARSNYKNIGAIYCPYFDHEVVFTSEGFGHIRYKGKRKERHFAAQKIRYNLLDLVPVVIAKSGTLQELEVQKSSERKVLFFGFIAIVDGWKLKVIVRQLGKGKKHFWSVIPNWRTRHSKEGKKFYNHTGNMHVD